MHPTYVSIRTRLVWGAIVVVSLLGLWKASTGNWPSGWSRWWFWLVAFFAGLGVFVLCPVPIVFVRTARMLAHGRKNLDSPSFRLSMPSVWTDVDHTEIGGASQLMRLEDDTFVILSIGTASAKIFTVPDLTRMSEAFEIASFPLEEMMKRHRPDEIRLRNEQELAKLRSAVGWPCSKWNCATTCMRFRMCAIESIIL